tara:strand:- start:3025 stop:3378 length:354 start_codon:yes stop_codon:yes gene_type:complete
MINKILLLILVVFSFELSAQESNNDKEATEFFSITSQKKYAEEFGYYFTKLPEGKNYQERIKGEVTINDTNNINFDKINVSFLVNDYQYYLVKNYNLLLVLKSINHLKKELRNEIQD